MNIQWWANPNPDLDLNPDLSISPNLCGIVFDLNIFKSMDLYLYLSLFKVLDFDLAWKEIGNIGWALGAGRPRCKMAKVA